MTRSIELKAAFIRTCPIKIKCLLVLMTQGIQQALPEEQPEDPRDDPEGRNLLKAASIQ